MYFSTGNILKINAGGAPYAGRRAPDSSSGSCSYEITTSTVTVSVHSGTSFSAYFSGNFEQSPQADFDSPIPSILRGAQQDFGARAESRSDLPICELRIPRSVLSHRECTAISCETKEPHSPKGMRLFSASYTVVLRVWTYIMRSKHNERMISAHHAAAGLLK